MTGSASRRRPLTDGERFVLSEVQAIYGPANTEAEVFFSDKDEAVIFARDAGGERIMGVVLTNLATWYADGTIKSVEALRRDWLSIPGGSAA